MKIFRKRFIPNEIIDISGDEVIYRDEEKLITKWKPIRPRTDFSYGSSCVYFSKGWKISKFFTDDGKMKFWYCDIIKYEYEANEDKYTLIDLLLDVIVHGDGQYEVLDEDELEQAFENGLIDENIKKEAYEKLNNLLEVIRNGKFRELDF